VPHQPPASPPEAVAKFVGNASSSAIAAIDISTFPSFSRLTSANGMSLLEKNQSCPRPHRFFFWQGSSVASWRVSLAKHKFNNCASGKAQIQ
jgi:hypothetical protein